ncbi:hypothetical protein PV10_01564 [Exophiala mesophila]|uniref:Major facilitator superfamily (MFS) profile domain-containing protein n=1 Tax=Exophiala mesophila TaxID=212818 RepID=A0A0D1X7M3_EXOME|nr:uncharacterized protein PV10_01564 [Exophiala mesophila]KIV97860.1 hypothetical protein PV10_01564 [Exophiala mesophila]
MGAPDQENVAQMGSAPGERQSRESVDSQSSNLDVNTHLIPPALSLVSTSSSTPYKVYKRRFFGLAQLVLLNIVVSWDWIAFAPVSTSSAEYFQTSESNINWISTAFLFAFVVATPFTFFVLHRFGCKTAIMAAASLLLVGNWIKYGATKASNFPGVMVGQLLIGFAQPFVLSSPTSYSNLWFSPRGRTTATAVASLANPFGAALGQLISPLWVSTPSDIPNMILYVAIISSVACVPSFFIPSHPPTPPSAGSKSLSDGLDRNTIKHDVTTLMHSPEFYLVFIPYSIFVGFFNAISSLLNQILEPHGFSEDDAGIAGAILIVVGLVCAAISSPVIDRYKFYLKYIKFTVPMIGLAYLIFIWAPQTGSLAYVYVVCAILGAASFGLVPVVLEFLVEIHYPLGPELGSSLCWCGGQLLGGIFIIIMDALKAGRDASPPLNMKRALIFQATLAMVAVPFALVLGLFGREERVRPRRWEADQGTSSSEEQEIRVSDSFEEPVRAQDDRTRS